MPRTFVLVEGLEFKTVADTHVAHNNLELSMHSTYKQPMRKALKALIYPKSKDEFFQSYESNSPFVVHNLKDSISELTELPLLKSLENLISMWPQKVEVHLPKIADEANAVQVSTGDAIKMFKNGMGLLFNDANLISPLLNQWLDDLRQDMGLSAMTYGRNLIYATKAGRCNQKESRSKAF